MSIIEIAPNGAHKERTCFDVEIKVPTGCGNKFLNDYISPSLDMTITFKQACTKTNPPEKQCRTEIYVITSNRNHTVEELQKFLKGVIDGKYVKSEDVSLKVKLPDKRPVDSCSIA